ncbi:MAG: hypothetical protein ABIJ96_01145 [Elusimicrobiota bacterium]
MFTKSNSEQFDSQLKSLQTQLAHATKRVNLIESALNSEDGGGGDPEELRQIRSEMGRMDASLKSALKSTVQLLDAFKAAQARNESAVRELTERLERLESLNNVKA